MCDFNRKNVARYTLIMAHLNLLYANDYLSDEDFDMLEKVFAQKYQIPENSIFKYQHKKKQECKGNSVQYLTIFV